MICEAGSQECVSEVIPGEGAGGRFNLTVYNLKLNWLGQSGDVMCHASVVYMLSSRKNNEITRSGERGMLCQRGFAEKDEKKEIQFLTLYRL